MNFRFGLYAVWEQEKEGALFYPAFLHRSWPDLLNWLWNVVDCTIDGDRLVRFTTLIPAHCGSLFAWQVAGWLARLAPAVRGYRVWFGLVVTSEDPLLMQQLRRSRLYQRYGIRERIAAAQPDPCCLFALSPQVLESPGHLQELQRELLSQFLAELSGREELSLSWFTPTPVSTPFCPPSWLTTDVFSRFWTEEDSGEVQVQVILSRPDGASLLLQPRTSLTWPLISLFDHLLHLPLTEALQLITPQSNLKAFTCRQPPPLRPLEQPQAFQVTKAQLAVHYLFSHFIPSWWFLYLRDTVSWSYLDARQGRILVQLAPEQSWFDWKTEHGTATLLVPTAYWPRDFHGVDGIPLTHFPQEIFIAHLVWAVTSFLPERQEEGTMKKYDWQYDFEWSPDLEPFAREYNLLAISRCGRYLLVDRPWEGWFAPQVIRRTKEEACE